MSGICKLDREAMRQNNVRMIFEEVYSHNGVTKAELSTKTGLSVVAVSRITDLLADQGLVVERDAEDNGRLGRPAKQVFVQRENLVNVGISLDIGGVFIGSVDPYGKLLAFESHALPLSVQPPAESLQKIALLLADFLERQGLTRLQSVGLVMPGIIDPALGHLRLASQLRWSDVPVASLLEQSAPLPRIILENDVKARAMAEHRFGSGKGYANMVLLTIGSGIGAGIIINNAIHRGKENMAGEIGHAPYWMNNRMCDCGGIGCAQATISEPALMQEARKVDPAIDMPGLVAAYTGGVPWAKRLITITAEYILTLIRLLANAYAPECMLLCGSLMDRCPPLRELVLNSAREGGGGHLNPTFAITYSRFGADGNIIGGATTAFHYNVEHIIAATAPAANGQQGNG